MKEYLSQRERKHFTRCRESILDIRNEMNECVCVPTGNFSKFFLDPREKTIWKVLLAFFHFLYVKKRLFSKGSTFDFNRYVGSCEYCEDYQLCGLRYTYLLTPWSRVLLAKLTGSQLLEKFPAFYGT